MSTERLGVVPRTLWPPGMQCKKGAPNPLADTLAGDDRVLACLPPDRVRQLLRASGYVGNTSERRAEFLKRLGAASLRRRVSRGLLLES